MLLNCIPASGAVSIGNRIGVGTTSPTTEIQVIGTITATTFSGNGSGLTGVANTGLLPVVAKGLVNGGFTLDLNEVDTAYVTDNITISLPTSGFISGLENKCIFDFNMASGLTLTPPTGVKWAGGTAPTFSTIASVRNILTFTTRDSGSTWEAAYSTFGGVETTFVQPALGANGALGGDSFAVYTPSIYSADYDAYKGVDNNSSTSFCSLGLSSGFYYIWYNPIALKVSSISITNRPDSVENITGYTLYASNNNSSWIALVTGTNNVIAARANWTLAVPSETQGFYKYYKLYVSSSSGTNNGFTQATLNATYMAQ